MHPVTQTKTAIIYPESDGTPMGETDLHISLLTYLREALLDYFRDEPQVYVAANLFLYYEEGNPAAVVAPDVFVVRGVPKGNRRIYKLWEEGQAPQVVFELTSRSTRLDDLGTKRALYALLGVSEYYIYDPYGDYLEPRLWAYHLEVSQGVAEYVRLLDPIVHSPALGLDLIPEGDLLRLRNSQTGQKLLTPFEAQAAHRAAEAEAARLRAELERLKSGKAKD
ncbi:MAG: Uma2 family endonuclease [Anaerolineae bacterium]|nr:Uma2 family endonuclease [Anaerolineae bacterium]